MFEIAPKISRTYKGSEEISIKKIDRPEFHDRLGVDEDHVEKLRESIARHGLMIPLWVRKNGERYTLIAGWHRLAALERTKITKVRVDIFDVTDEEANLLTTIENEHRKQRSALDRIRSILHQTYLGWYRMLEEEGNKPEYKMDSVVIQAALLYKNYLKYGLNGSTEDNQTRMLFASFEQACESFVINPVTVIKRLRLFDLPPKLLVVLREEKLSIRSGMEASKWYKKIRGRMATPKSGTRGKLREDAIVEFVMYVHDNLPSQDEVTKKGEEIFYRLRDGLQKNDTEERLASVIEKIQNTELDPRTELAVNKLLKKIEKLLPKTKK